MSTLLHSILFSLIGSTGDIIVEQYDPVNSNKLMNYELTAIINDSIINTSERQLINKIVTLGYRYTVIKQYCAPHNTITHSIYINGLIHGLNGILQQYSDVVYNIERNILQLEHNNAQPFTLTELYIELKPYYTIFDSLIQLIQYIELHQVHGCILLNVLYNIGHTGIETVSNTMNAIIKHVLYVVLTQTNDFITNGTVYDPYNEFYIQLYTTTHSNHAHGNKSSKQIQVLRYDQFNWHTTYTLQHGYIPQHYISYGTANKLLFIGKAVFILKQSQLIHHKQILNAATYPECQQFVEQVNHIKQQPTESYDSTYIDKLVESLRIQITKRLWKLIVCDSRLVQHLSTLKSYYLLSNGEFVQLFISQYAQLIQRSPSFRAERDIHTGIWYNTATTCRVDDNQYFKQLRFKVDSSVFDYNTFKQTDVVHSNTYVNGLQLCGNTRLIKPIDHSSITNDTNNKQYHIQLLNTISGCNHGTVWYNKYRCVQDGFSCKFVVDCVTDYSETSSRLGYVFTIQNQCIPLDVKCSIENSITSNITNGMSIEFVLQHSTTTTQPHCTISIYQHSLIDNSHKCIATTVYRDNNIFDHTPHTVTIDYNPQSSTMNVWMEDTTIPTLSTTCKLRNLIQLDAGRAYIGISGLSSNNHQSSIITLHSWLYRQTESNSDYCAGGWNNISLQYTIDKPVDLVLLHNSFEKYNNLYRYLLQFKLSQYQLQQCWAVLQHRAKQPSNDIQLQQQLFTLHQQMQYYINTIIQYIHVDIIDVQYHKLIDVIDHSQEFESVVTAHNTYLSTITQQCFLHDRLLYTTVCRLIDCCLRFTHTILHNDTVMNPTYINTTNSEWCDQLCLFYTAIARQANTHTQSIVSQLVGMLDYNGYYSQMIVNNGMSSVIDNEKYSTESKENESESNNHVNIQPLRTAAVYSQPTQPLPFNNGQISNMRSLSTNSDTNDPVYELHSPLRPH